MMLLIDASGPMGYNTPTPISSKPRNGSPGGMLHWMVETINHVFGNPREEAAHQPPAVGVQPYRDRPVRER
jgi:hypothetical protein